MYNRLRRSKLDANREINEATFNVPDARTAYHDFTSFINKARSAISGRGLLLDLHGQANKIQRTQLGYLIHRSNLDRGDYCIADSCIRSLGKFWCGSANSCFKDFIHGNRSLGHLLNEEGLQAVPSPQEKTPNREPYFNGGYIVKKYGSKDGGNIDGIQIEFPAKLRFGWGNDGKRRTARAISRFFELNYL